MCISELIYYGIRDNDAKNMFAYNFQVWISVEVSRNKSVRQNEGAFCLVLFFDRYSGILLRENIITKVSNLSSKMAGLL